MREAGKAGGGGPVGQGELDGWAQAERRWGWVSGPAQPQEAGGLRNALSRAGFPEDGKIRSSGQGGVPSPGVLGRRGPRHPRRGSSGLYREARRDGGEDAASGGPHAHETGRGRGHVTPCVPGPSSGLRLAGRADRRSSRPLTCPEKCRQPLGVCPSGPLCAGLACTLCTLGSFPTQY